MSDEPEDYRGLSRVSRVELELKCRIHEIEAQGAIQITRNIQDLVFRRHGIQNLEANEATAETDARALQAPPAPVAGGSGQLVQAPQEAPPTGHSGSVRRRAPGSDTSNTPVCCARGGEHRGSIGPMPVCERPTHIRSMPYDRATCTPISYVSLSLTVSMSHYKKTFYHESFLS